MSQADHVLNMLNQITTGLHDKELEYAAAITQSCTYMANMQEREAAKEAMDILYEIQQVLTNWRGMIERLTINAQEPESPASKMLPATAELLDVSYSDMTLRMLLLHIQTFMANHLTGLPPVDEVQAAPAADGNIRIRSIETGEMLSLTMDQVLELLNTQAQDGDLPPSIENWQQMLDEQGVWELLSDDDYETAAAQADRTN